ncbi:MAG TPA: c-type cytochrome [Parvibaculum sp.]
MSIGRIVLWAGAAVATFVVIAIAAVFTIFPRVSAAPDMKVEMTPARIAYGDYLFNHRMSCTACHTPELEPHRFSRVSDRTRIGAGRHMGGPADGFPAEIYAPNLTPAALGGWTDGEIYRAIVSGVTREGRALFPLMPYPSYHILDREDAEALVAYIRSLPPQPVTLPRIRLPMPLPVFMRFVPADPTSEARPSPKDEVALGKYLTTTSACFECHTRRNSRGEPVGIPFAGGNVFSLPGGGVARSANITPDHETGIGDWSRAQFIARFRAVTPDAAAKVAPEPQDMDTEMPWTDYSGMTDEDLGAIYAYLQSLPPTHAEVVKFDPPAPK